MPEWAAFGVKSSTSVAPLGAPGSAPPPPQPAPPAASRAAASSAATRLIEPGTLVLPPNRDRLPPLVGPRKLRREQSAGARTFGIFGRVDRHIPAGVLHHQRRRSVLGYGRPGAVRLRLCGYRPRPSVSVVRPDRDVRR